jgi:hypothetical protein
MGAQHRIRHTVVSSATRRILRGHSAYNTSQLAIIGVFNKTYLELKVSGNWGSYGSELGWLQAQAPTIHGYAAFLKTELVNPNSALKLHSSDTSRSDLKSGETWSRFSSTFFDADTLSFNSAITVHASYLEASQFQLGGMREPAPRC